MTSKASPVPRAAIPMSPPSIVWSPRYEVDIGAHLFPTRKYRLVRERLLSEGVVPADGPSHYAVETERVTSSGSKPEREPTF